MHACVCVCVYAYACGVSGDKETHRDQNAASHITRGPPHSNTREQAAQVLVQVQMTRVASTKHSADPRPPKAPIAVVGRMRLWRERSSSLRAVFLVRPRLWIDHFGLSFWERLHGVSRVLFHLCSFSADAKKYWIEWISRPAFPSCRRLCARRKLYVWNVQSGTVLMNVLPQFEGF